ncbi:MAG TPA: rRNA maturation RNase YbeY [Bacteriovoracaceae bacterium]|nr:rRNA maturation RNase YbeY [Bacteriovoracaceae bacterium]
MTQKIIKGLELLAEELAHLLFAENQNSLNLDRQRIEGVELTITFCGQQHIRQLNTKYRQKNKITDVLSFALHADLRNSKKTNGHFALKKLNLGDIVICREVAKRQSLEFEIPLYSEVLHLALHGMLHLCGYDHEQGGKEQKIMEWLEDFYIRRLIKK